MKKALILGTSRKNGNTKKVVNELLSISDFDLFDLSDYDISHFDYEHSNKDDDFIKLIKNLIDNYDVMVFATPVYWYSMSGIMKVFFDRFSDLLTIEKTYGRKLKCKYIAVITSSIGGNLGYDFWVPFKRTAEYLEMNYITGLHTIVDKVNKVDLENFVSTIEKIKK